MGSVQQESLDFGEEEFAVGESELSPLTPTQREYDRPPEFTLQPNPYLDDLVDPSVPAKQVKKPYDESISAGKNTYVYDAHTYHTKVPPEGVELLIEHYTERGDTILDPFCGSGMTGVAASRHNRKIILCDLAPAATFIAYNINTPIDAQEYLEAVQQLRDWSRKLERYLYGTHYPVVRPMTLCLVLLDLLRFFNAVSE